MKEGGLYTELGPEVEVGGSRWETEERRSGSCWSGGGLCLEEVSMWGGCWRRGEEWRAEGAAWRWGKVEGGRGCCHLTGGADSSGVKCRRAWTGGCRSGSEEQGRVYSG